MATAAEEATSAPISAERIDAAPRRLEGREKVMGRLRYTGDLAGSQLGIPDEQLLHAVPVVSARSTGSVIDIDVEQALRAAGVRAVMTHENAPRLKKVFVLSGAEVAQLLPMQDGTLHYGGQCIAVVVADTLQHAIEASVLVKVRYSDPAPDRAFELKDAWDRAEDAKTVGAGDPGHVKVGDAEKAYDAAAHQIEVTFTSSPHHHNAMEPGTAVAIWDGDEALTVHMPTQFSYNEAVLLGEAFGFGFKDRLPGVFAQLIGKGEFSKKVRVLAPPLGGAFGGKTCNTYGLIAAMAAKVASGPVKLLLNRQHVFTMMPFRGEIHQRIRLGADEDGKLTSLRREAVVATGAKGAYIEPVNETAGKLYACPNILLNTQSARLDTGAPGWMRGPGAGADAVGIGIAMDMLAHQIGADPLQFLIDNHADIEPDTGKEWSSKSLKACYKAGAERIGWFDRNPEVGSMREGRHLVGYGVATSMYPTLQMPSVARCILGADGRARFQTAQHELGQGMITTLTAIGAEALGLPLDQVTLEFGDTWLPYGGMTVGSMTTLTNGASIHDAGTAVRKALLKHAVRDRASPLHGSPADDLVIYDGQVVGAGGARESVASLMARHPKRSIEQEAVTGRTQGHSKYGRACFGAQFAKVLIDPDTAHLQVASFIGAFACGRVISPVLGRSQLMGGMIWGLGQALIEESVMDPRLGMWMNRSLGEALVPTNADVAQIEALMIEEDDTRGHPLGVKGMGEIGAIGGPAAICNAIFHATGVRLLDQPFRFDKLLAGMRERH